MFVLKVRNKRTRLHKHLFIQSVCSKRIKKIGQLRCQKSVCGKCSKSDYRLFFTQHCQGNACWPLAVSYKQLYQINDQSVLILIQLSQDQQLLAKVWVACLSFLDSNCFGWIIWETGAPSLVCSSLIWRTSSPIIPKWRHPLAIYKLFTRSPKSVLTKTRRSRQEPTSVSSNCNPTSLI